MSYFEGQGSNWPQHRRQQSWDPSQTNTASASTFDEASSAFTSQFEEISRASDILARGAKSFGAPNRRDSTPIAGAFDRQYPETDSRLSGIHRSHLGAEYDGMRSHSSHSSAGLQGYLANQRFGSRPSEAEQMMQAKRRAAAQRERELRNYHQEQQYNRNLSGAKSDRAMSPSAMNEEDRRELIARQHRALYGSESNLYLGESASPRPASQDARLAAGHGASPMSFDSFKMPGGTPESGAKNSVDSQSRTDASASPAPNPTQFTMFDNSQQPARTSASPPTNSPPRTGAKAGAVGVAPIGTRPQASGPKRASPPTSSNMNYAFHNDKINPSAERSTSAASNSAAGSNESAHALGWSSGPWGAPKSSLGVQASVWG